MPLKLSRHPGNPNILPNAPVSTTEICEILSFKEPGTGHLIFKSFPVCTALSKATGNTQITVLV